jgi:hypothetical protein
MRISRPTPRRLRPAPGPTGTLHTDNFDKASTGVAILAQLVRSLLLVSVLTQLTLVQMVVLRRPTALSRL